MMNVIATLASAQTAAPIVSLRAVPAETTAAAYVDKRWRAPRTSWGHPSLEGVWSKIESLGVTEKDVESAVQWARRRK